MRSALFAQQRRPVLLRYKLKYASMEQELRYEDVQQRERAEIEEMLASNDPAEIAKALRSATYHDPDWRWVQSKCLQLITHTETEVSWNSAVCLGLLAVFHKQLDLDLVVPALHKAIENPIIRPAAENSLDDIQLLIKLQ